MLLRLVLLVSIFFATSIAQACYWPDGSKDDKLPQPDYVPCNGASSDGFSSCCNVNDTCTTNGFCKYNGLANTNFLWRNTCTDKSGKSPNCAQHCTVDSKSMIQLPPRNLDCLLVLQLTTTSQSQLASHTTIVDSYKLVLRPPIAVSQTSTSVVGTSTTTTSLVSPAAMTQARYSMLGRPISFRESATSRRHCSQ
jgi:hypothetical protein